VWLDVDVVSQYMVYMVYNCVYYCDTHYILAYGHMGIWAYDTYLVPLIMSSARGSGDRLEMLPIKTESSRRLEPK
jgi:hypothetical protein